MRFARFLFLSWLLALMLSSVPGFAAAPSASTPPALQFSAGPTITKVRGRTVRVHVPAGYEQVRIERLANRRLAKWATFAIAPAKVEGGEVSLVLRRAIARRYLRVVGRPVAPVPSTVPGRPTTFVPPPEAAATHVGLTLEGGTFLANASNDTTLSLHTDSAGAAESVSRSVEESDIWKLKGDRLYVFNPYRGLQVLNLANPAVPVLLGTLYLPHAGDALYTLGANHVVLLARRPSSFTWNNEPLAPETAVLVCDVRSGQPEIVASLPLGEEILESRLVGSALYVATAVYPENSPLDRRYSVRVSGFDLSDPAAPVARDSVIIERPVNLYGNVATVQASDRAFMVAQNIRTGTPYLASRVSYVDISNPDGTSVMGGSVTTAGVIEDKFKMHERGGILTLISNVRNGSHTKLENFSLAQRSAPALVGSLVLGENERVYGTRFDGDRVYIVTFRQIDPLWIVDNSVPSAPVIKGHLEIPGFSTYIEPLGDRLVTIGLWNNRVTVSLFDVADPTQPKVLSQLPVTEPWAWSEATWNEKAFSVNPQAGLILVPVNTAWFRPTGAGLAGGVQLLDLERQQLRVRGKITRDFVPRRAAFHRGTIVALSTADLLIASPQNRDRPEILAEVQLAWTADFAWRLGNYVVQVGGDITGGNPMISSASADSPNDTTHSVALGKGRVVAADVREGYLYVLQEKLPLGTNTAEGQNSLSVYDVSSLPRLVKRGELDVPAPRSFGVTSRLLWPQPGTLVIASQEHHYSNVYPPIIIKPMELLTADNASLSVLTDGLATQGFIGGHLWFSPTQRTLRFTGVDVTNPVQPRLLAQTIVAPNHRGSFSEVFAAAGKLFVSRNNGWGGDIYRVVLSDSAAPPELEPAGAHFLHVLDYANPAAPVARPPVSAPGVLKGVARNGTVLFTEAWPYDSHGVARLADPVVHVSGYDGQKVELATQLPLGATGSALPVGEAVFTFGQEASSETNGLPAQYAKLWEISPDLDAVPRGKARFAGYDPRALDNVLFTASYAGSGHWLHAVDFVNPDDLRPIGWLHTPTLGNGLHRMTGDRTNAFWLPTGSCGLMEIKLPAQTE
jgi:uncharacterized secreted protein with C-terminal beta-propeller domain